VKYNPQDAKPPLIPPGMYDAELKSVQDTKDDGSPLRTAKGDEMIKVIFKVYATEREATISAYFVNNNNSLWRYKQLAEALGYAERFESAQFHASEHIGELVKVELKIKSSEQYGEQNEIAKFTRRAAVATATKPAPTPAAPLKKPPMTEEDIPF
jgi:hypothetical protein